MITKAQAGLLTGYGMMLLIAAIGILTGPFTPAMREVLICVWLMLLVSAVLGFLLYLRSRS